MPTIASTNSDADSEKNGTSASPATARASSVLPVPGGPLSSTPCGMRPPSLWYLLGLAQEVDDLGQLGLRLVDPGDVGEGDLVARRLVAPRARAAERAEHPLDVARPPHQPKTRRPTKRIVGPNPTSRLSHHGVLDVSGCALTTTPLALEQLRERLRVGERGDLGAGSASTASSRRSSPCAERPLDRRPLRGDRRHAARADLFQEVGAVGHADARRRLGRLRPGPVVEREQRDDQRDEAPAGAEPSAYRAQADGGGAGVLIPERCHSERSCARQPASRARAWAARTAAESVSMS